ncbi:MULTISPECIES: PH domain-containing protein [Staphylococcus]|uniref:PH domain-containing protein n=1 Tax=Staphylococcus hsinchuensis TaxID=3051183 RepID=A0ABZ3EDQ9_9STAP|nr:PH domain-containing protein [Staphylococcus sp. Marseille-Q5304]
MTQYNYMEPSGVKVMRISALITIVILLLVAAILFIVDSLWLNLLSKSAHTWYLVIGGCAALVSIIVWVIIVPKVKYKIFRYKINDHEVIVKRGVWFVEEVKVPIFRIQNIDSFEGLLMRKHKLTNLTLSTAGGTIEIKLINKKQASNIKRTIKQMNRDRER